MTEVWKPIPGWPPYEVSDLGRVKRVSRGRGAVKGRIMKAGGPTPSVFLSHRGRYKHEKVSRLVLLTFVGPCPSGMEGCHEDDDPTNNRLTNLRWDTHKANAHDAVRNGLMCNPNVKLTADLVRKLREEYRPGKLGPGVRVGSLRYLAEKYGVSRSHVVKLVRGQFWK